MHLDNWIKTVKVEEFPLPPFSLTSGVTVIGVEKWLDYIKMNCPARRKTGALQSQRREAFTIWNLEQMKRGENVSF